MKVELDIPNKRCVVTREPHDPPFHGTANAKGESRFLHHVKMELNRQGFDVIKKRMHKDGHMVDNMQQYLRSRSKKTGFMLYNSEFAIHGLNDVWNQDGRVVLTFAPY